METFQKFYSYLEDLNQSYGKLAGLLQEKLEAINRFDVDKMEAIIKEEQVYVLLSRGFDSNVQGYRQKLSLKGETLGEIAAEVPEEWRGRFAELAGGLKTTLYTVRDLNNKCQKLLEAKLYVVDKKIKEADKNGAGVYNQKAAAKPAGGAHILSKSV